jgi:hypothetical protein
MQPGQKPYILHCIKKAQEELKAIKEYVNEDHLDNAPTEELIRTAKNLHVAVKRSWTPYDQHQGQYEDEERAFTMWMHMGEQAKMISELCYALEGWHRGEWDEGAKADTPMLINQARELVGHKPAEAVEQP